ncbi:MAG: DUF3352 domain-containing protein [Symploca sp. SIO2E6]|nr:DUF3352 domain-containing protein [Symploca sp. SIO2E6]
MKLRSLFYSLVAIVIVLLLSAGWGFFWLTSQNPLNLLEEMPLSKPTAAIFVPKQSSVMTSLMVHPDRLEEFRQLVAYPLNRRQSRAQLNQLENSLLANTSVDLDYRRDIQPWLGDEITLAVISLDYDRNPENSLQPGYLLAVTTKDAEKAREFLQLFYSKQAIAGTVDIAFEQYKGVNLIYRRPLGTVAASTIATNPSNIPETLTSAVVGERFVLFANHPKVLKTAINNVQAANLSLDNNAIYQQTLQTLTGPRIGLGFVNIPALGAWISHQPTPVQDSLQSSETLGIALTLNRQGLLAQTALLGIQPSDLSLNPVLEEPVKALEYIPATSALAVAGTDLNQFWDRLSTGVARDELLKTLLNQSLTRLQSNLKVELPQDIFSWVEGEYAISQLSRTDKANPDWLFVVEKTDKEKDIESIEYLDNLAKQQGLSVGILPLGEQTITVWTKLTTSAKGAGKKNRLMRLEAQVYGVHAAVGDYEIFSSSVDAMDQALGGRVNSLLNNKNFQEAIAPLPHPNDGYLYIDWQKSETFLKEQLPIVRVLDLVGEPLFEHLRSLSLSSYGIDNGIQRSDLFFRLD